MIMGSWLETGVVIIVEKIRDLHYTGLAAKIFLLSTTKQKQIALSSLVNVGYTLAYLQPVSQLNYANHKMALKKLLK